MNPFDSINTEKDIWTYINKIYENDKPTTFAEQHLINQQKYLLASCFTYVLLESNPEDRNLTNILVLLRCGLISENYDYEYESTLDILFKDIKEKYGFKTEDCPVVLYYEIYNTCNYKYKHQNEIISSCIMKMLSCMDYELSTRELVPKEVL